MYCSTLKEVQADVACGQEHNLDSVQTSVRTTLFDTTRQHWQRSKINFANTPNTFRIAYKPGGTYMMTMGNISGHIRTTYQDKWGWWTSQTFQGREDNTLTIILAYQVVTDTPGKGLITAASQQLSILIQEQDPVRSPRAAFRRDLQIYIQQCRSAGHEILLMGDFNERIGEDHESIHKLINDIGLIDVMKTRHTENLPTTYARGHRCLDYALATPHVIRAVKKAGYEAFNARYSTDHCSYYVDLSAELLFGIQIQPLSKFEPRMLQSSNRVQVTEYIRTKHRYLSAHKCIRETTTIGTTRT
jgi:hypothetical protein